MAYSIVVFNCCNKTIVNDKLNDKLFARNIRVIGIDSLDQFIQAFIKNKER